MEKSLKSKILETFNYLHANPELSWEEKNTTEYIKNLLVEEGCKVHTFHDCTGVVGDIGNFSGNVPNYRN